MRRACVQSLVLVFVTAILAIANDKSSLVKVSNSFGNGTGSVVRVLKDKPIADGYQGYVLTALHVVIESVAADRRDIKIAFENGQVAKECKVIAFDFDNDLAIIWAWVPAEVIPVKIASQSVVYNDELLFVGLGGGIDITIETAIRRIPGKASAPTNPYYLYSDTVLIPGDSGGPVYNNAGELVGIISAGWIKYKLNSNDQERIWPACAINTKPIRELMKKLELNPPAPTN